MLPQLDSSTYVSQLFWLFVSIAILVVSLRRRFIPRINGILSKREKLIESGNKEVKVLNTEAEKLENTLRSLREAEVKKSSEIIQVAIKNSEKTLSEQLGIAKAENDEIMSGTRKKLNNDINSLESDFKPQIDATAQTIFEKMFVQDKV
ncbi:MAG: ATP synthase F0 subunit B [Holosporales bacterium]|jgi:F-type H+-transporting ATPase subunit b|nr:ATP synthase F0 subunit B [Holosporales bacterium]